MLLLQLMMKLTKVTHKFLSTEIFSNATTTIEAIALSEINVDMNISKKSVVKLFAEIRNVRKDIQ